jgi:hypothetical protein
MNRYIICATTDIDLKRNNRSGIKVNVYHSLGRIEFYGGSGFSDVDEYKVAKVLVNTKDDMPLIKKGDIVLQFKTEKLEFDSDDAAILWFKLKYN